MTDRVRISALRKTGDHRARISILSGDGGVEVYDIWLEQPVPDEPDIRTLIHLISMSVGEIGIHQWRDGYRMREMEEQR